MKISPIYSPEGRLKFEPLDSDIIKLVVQDDKIGYHEVEARDKSISLQEQKRNLFHEMLVLRSRVR